MRTAYRDDLAALRAQLADMCGLAADAMDHASQALLQADLELAEQVITDHGHIADKWRATEDSAVKLLALQQPVASDLRRIVGALHVGADIERMGALAVHVANIARLRHPEQALDRLVLGLGRAGRRSPRVPAALVALDLQPAADLGVQPLGEPLGRLDAKPVREQLLGELALPLELVDPPRGP